MTQMSRRFVKAAVRCFEEAERLGFNGNECQAMRWRCWMLLGDFEKAWRVSDAVAACGGHPQALWDGRPFGGERVLVRCVHGLGDTIHFIRYAALLKAAGCEVIVETHPELVTLLSRLPFLDRVKTWAGDPVHRHEWDRQIEIMELPYAFRTTVDTIPAAIPYMEVPPPIKLQSRNRLRISSNRPAVGVMWASSSWNPARSIDARQMAAVVDCDLPFYSFQRGDERADINVLRRNRNIVDTSEFSPGIADTAADLANMDLLITVDTMAAHLAGALGIPTWILLPFEADWRWMIDRTDTPWYPLTRLFRQPVPGDWAGVIESVVEELHHFPIP
jgi:ADP-heptose:LPS heptosyltransferase